MPTDPAALLASRIAALRAGLLDAAGTGELRYLSRYLSRDFRSELRRAEEAIADALPALTPADFRRMCNGDHAIAAEVERFRDSRWSIVDVTDLSDGGEDADHYPDTWTILRGSSRFEVREVPRYEVRRTGGAGQAEGWAVWDNEDNEQADDGEAIEALGLTDDDAVTSEDLARAVCAWLMENDNGYNVFVVVDTNTSGPEGWPDGDARDLTDRDYDFDSYDVTDESEAEEAATAGNLEDYRQNAAGWPFAHNYAAAIDERDADDFDAAGFVVARHEPSGQVYAGIDGGGYSFTDQHWAPLYLRFLLPASRGVGVFRQDGPTHIYVPTDDGLRRVVRS